MPPNYYLLRNNHESGPYTIDELLLQGLGSTDLVWVEGRTNAWCHPSELEELTISFSINREKLKELTPKPGKQRIPHRHKRIGRDKIEERAEEIRKNVLNHHRVQTPSRRIELEEDGSPTTFNIPEERIDLVIHKKKISLPGAHFTAIAIMALFIAGVWYAKDIWVNESRFLDAVAKPLESSAVVSIPEKKESPVRQAFTVSAVSQARDSADLQSLVSEDSSAAKIVETRIVPATSISKPVVENKVVVADTPSKTNIPEPVVIPDVSVDKVKPEVDDKKETTKKEPEVKKDKPKLIEADKKTGEDKDVKQEKKADTVITEQKEKKRGFLGRLFKKKKNEE